ncbi:hypothetical protein RM812_09610 [Streptomyces sp. DSM 40712]|uniref:Uncharacterized protein n=1 Tax=Streptomyces lancefieldiae TaxID=3075520 RepID=A0ABU3ANS2_9ACTN|nr:hypothetical protein [Streptomyces sp. DSM 40712]MDT0610486.1 hypothetical protein [Streptomyces sp. DSM 40712]
MLLLPPVRALVIGVGVTLLGHTLWRGRRGPGRPTVEDEYGRRLSVLDERFGRTGESGGA